MGTALKTCRVPQVGIGQTQRRTPRLQQAAPSTRKHSAVSCHPLFILGSKQNRDTFSNTGHPSRLREVNRRQPIRLEPKNVLVCYMGGEYIVACWRFLDAAIAVGPEQQPLDTTREPPSHQVPSQVCKFARVGPPDVRPTEAASARFARFGRSDVEQAESPSVGKSDQRSPRSLIKTENRWSSDSPYRANKAVFSSRSAFHFQDIFIYCPHFRTVGHFR